MASFPRAITGNESEIARYLMTEDREGRTAALTVTIITTPIEWNVELFAESGFPPTSGPKHGAIRQLVVYREESDVVQRSISTTVHREELRALQTVVATTTNAGQTMRRFERRSIQPTIDLFSEQHGARRHPFVQHRTGLLEEDLVLYFRGVVFEEGKEGIFRLAEPQTAASDLREPLFSNAAWRISKVGNRWSVLVETEDYRTIELQYADTPRRELTFARHSNGWAMVLEEIQSRDLTKRSE